MMRSRCAPSSRCTIPKMRVAVQQPKRSTVTQTALFKTSCSDLYSSLTYIALQVPQTLNKNYEFLWRFLQQLYDSKNTYGSTPPEGEHYDANGFSCTHYTDLYSSLTYIPLRVTQTVYTNYELSWCHLQQVFHCESEHGSATPQGMHCNANVIFVHRL